ncbi:MAG: hypothetical protein WC631_01940 [Candidatus Paceibacterota bacterium]|jgi:hypothetical protein
MPNGHGDKKYGPHKYADHGGTSDCEHKCGCWMGPSRSGGPVGINPFGQCPGNPLDGQKLGGKEDYELVVDQRIADLEQRVWKAEEALKKVRPSKKKIVDELEQAKKKLAEAKELIEDWQKKAAELAW